MATLADERPVVILLPHPQRSAAIFTTSSRLRLETHFRVIDLEGETADAPLDAAIREAFAIIGQPDLPTDRLARAAKLRAVLNVEGNFYPNVDFERCFRTGVHVLGCGPAYAQAVAE
jgi:phosphoglycerate dehydrogenase-like enzyme